MEQIDVDVAVIGGGACGSIAALRASQNSQIVVGVFEKSTHQGCNAEISSGSLAAGGTRFQSDAGIVDSPTKHADEILDALQDPPMAEMVRALCEAAPRYVEWMADELAFPVELGTDMPRIGMSVPRLHTDSDRRGGRRLMTHLRQALSDRENVAFVDESPAVSLVVEAGAVVGALVEQNGKLAEVRANTVVLATDGFAGNPDLMESYCSDLGNPLYCGSSTSRGDAIPWLLDLDVAFKNLGSCLRHGQVVAGYGTRVSPALPFFGAIILNASGERIVNEKSVGYSSLAGIIQEQKDERAVMVWDAEAMARTSDSELMRTSISAGAFRSFDDIQSLANELAVDSSALAGSLRPLSGRRKLKAPYHLAWLTHGVLSTHGGAVVDVSGHVLRQDGSRVPGLRAGGGVAVGLSGPDSKGYSSGNGLLSAFGMGWIIGTGLMNGC